MTICWNIYRASSTTLTKVYGTECPCTHDPINNPNCRLYEEVVIHEIKEMDE